MFYGLLHMDTPVLPDLQKTYIHSFSADTGCRLEDLPRMMTDRDGCESGGGEREFVLSTHLDNDDINMTYKLFEYIHIRS